MEVIFLPDAEDDLKKCVANGNKQMLKKISQIIDDIKLHPFEGIGKPEPLKHELSGAWSRRINREHRLVYEVDDEIILILSARGHYS